MYFSISYRQILSWSSGKDPFMGGFTDVTRPYGPDIELDDMIHFTVCSKFTELLWEVKPS